MVQPVPTTAKDQITKFSFGWGNKIKIFSEHLIVAGCSGKVKEDVTLHFHSPLKLLLHLFKVHDSMQPISSERGRGSTTERSAVQGGWCGVCGPLTHLVIKCASAEVTSKYRVVCSVHERRKKTGSQRRTWICQLLLALATHTVCHGPEVTFLWCAYV